MPKKFIPLTYDETRKYYEGTQIEWEESPLGIFKAHNAEERQQLAAELKTLPESEWTPEHWLTDLSQRSQNMKQLAISDEGGILPFRLFNSWKIFAFKQPKFMLEQNRPDTLVTQQERDYVPTSNDQQGVLGGFLDLSQYIAAVKETEWAKNPQLAHTVERLFRAYHMPLPIPRIEMETYEEARSRMTGELKGDEPTQDNLRLMVNILATYEKDSKDRRVPPYEIYSKPDVDSEKKAYYAETMDYVHPISQASKAYELSRDPKIMQFLNSRDAVRAAKEGRLRESVDKLYDNYLDGRKTESERVAQKQEKEERKEQNKWRKGVEVLDKRRVELRTMLTRLGVSEADFSKKPEELTVPGSNAYNKMVRATLRALQHAESTTLTHHDEKTNTDTPYYDTSYDDAIRKACIDYAKGKKSVRTFQHGRDRFEACLDLINCVSEPDPAGMDNYAEVDALFARVNEVRKTKPGDRYYAARENCVVDREAKAREEQAARERAEREERERERALHDVQEMEERAAREARAAQERAAREAQEAQERAAREAREAQERAAREVQEAQERAARERRQKELDDMAKEELEKLRPELERQQEELTRAMLAEERKRRLNAVVNDDKNYTYQERLAFQNREEKRLNQNRSTAIEVSRKSRFFGDKVEDLQRRKQAIESERATQKYRSGPAVAERRRRIEALAEKGLAEQWKKALDGYDFFANREFDRQAGGKEKSAAAYVNAMLEAAQGNKIDYLNSLSRAGGYEEALTDWAEVKREIAEDEKNPESPEALANREKNLEKMKFNEAAMLNSGAAARAEKSRKKMNLCAAKAFICQSLYAPGEPIDAKEIDLMANAMDPADLEKIGGCLREKYSYGWDKSERAQEIVRKGFETMVAPKYIDGTDRTIRAPEQSLTNSEAVSFMMEEMREAFQNYREQLAEFEAGELKDEIAFVEMEKTLPYEPKPIPPEVMEARDLALKTAVASRFICTLAEKDPQAEYDPDLLRGLCKGMMDSYDDTVKVVAFRDGENKLSELDPNVPLDKNLLGRIDQACSYTLQNAPKLFKADSYVMEQLAEYGFDVNPEKRLGDAVVPEVNKAPFAADALGL